MEPVIITTQGGTHHNHHFSLQWAFSLQWVVAWTGPSACTNQFVPVRWEERATLHRPEREEVCSVPEPCLCPRFFESLPTEDRPVYERTSRPANGKPRRLPPSVWRRSMHDGAGNLLLFRSDFPASEADHEEGPT